MAALTWFRAPKYAWKDVVPIGSAKEHLANVVDGEGWGPLESSPFRAKWLQMRAFHTIKES